MMRLRQQCFFNDAWIIPQRRPDREIQPRPLECGAFPPLFLSPSRPLRDTPACLRNRRPKENKNKESGGKAPHSKGFQGHNRATTPRLRHGNIDPRTGELGAWRVRPKEKLSMAASGYSCFWTRPREAGDGYPGAKSSSQHAVNQRANGVSPGPQTATNEGVCTVTKRFNGGFPAHNRRKKLVEHRRLARTGDIRMVATGPGVCHRQQTPQRRAPAPQAVAGTRDATRSHSDSTGAPPSANGRTACWPWASAPAAEPFSARRGCIASSSQSVLR